MADTLGVTSALRDSILVSNPPAENTKTSHKCPNVDSLEGTDKVGTKQCVALVLYYTKTQNNTAWEQGGAVIGNDKIEKGTAVATFVNGKYLNNKTGNHAGFYMSQDSNGFTIMDQWFDDVKKPKVSSRYLSRRGKNSDGSFVNPSNNADAFSIVLW
jgi:hypothetical protein